MPASLSIESRLQEGLRERGMSTTEFARVAELENIRFASRAQLDRAFRDDKPLRGDVAERLWSLWQEIEHLQFWCYVAGLPCKIDLSDGTKVHEWLQMLRERMRSEQARENSNDSKATVPADNIQAQG